MPTAGSSRSPLTGENIMVGCDDVLEHIVDELTKQQRSDRRVIPIPIVGMGGIGKTTLAKNVYGNQSIVEHFDIRAWATISQEFYVKEILIQLLLCQKDQDSRECLSKQSEVELRDRLYKSLFGRRYLIILDDMWSNEAWNEVRSLFPDNDNGSRAIITTRQSNMAFDLTGGHRDYIIKMNFLNDDMSWELLSKVVFGSKAGCSVQLEEIGRKIAKSCKGLPLPIVVIGGLLARSEKSLDYWQYIAVNLHSLEESESCLNLLYSSYNHLPIHLKPCFLYMGIFEEDYEIDVNKLIPLWVAEGFLKPISGKSLEEVAIEYLEELVDRNLILVEKRNHNGEVKLCRIHDLLRDLCLKESQKDKFLVVIGQHSLNNPLQGINTLRRVSIQIRSKEMNQYNFLQIRDALHSNLLARTLISYSRKILPSPNNRLLRVFYQVGLMREYASQQDECSPNSITQLVNLRCLTLCREWMLHDTYLFWNLQTIDIFPPENFLFEIWKMPLLRCVDVLGHSLTNPGQDDFVLGNLHTISYAKNFNCSEEVVKRMPNIKTLKILYGERFIGSRYCFNNLTSLHKLEQLAILFFFETPSRSELLPNLTFPHSIRELALLNCGLYWEDISIKIGSLPLLQVLKLERNSFMGPEWETTEGQFDNLKILEIQNCFDLKCWKTDSSHFPRLEELILEGLFKLEEIPSAIGDISALRLIKVRSCSNSAIISAKEIAKEQEELGNPDLHVRVEVGDEDEYEEMKSWAHPNFEVCLV